jgi:predicted nucleic acid-binding protein
LTEQLTKQQLIDACGVINLCACRRLPDVVATYGRFLIVKEVSSEVVDTVEGTVGSLQLVSETVELNETELATYIQLASLPGMDDGEAATFAVAHHRALAVITDDRRAIRVARKRMPNIEIIGTAMFLRDFAARVNLSREEVSELLHAVEEDASFSPRADDENAAWWARACDSADAA